MFGEVTKAFGKGFLVAQLLPVAIFIYVHSLLVQAKTLPPPGVNLNVFGLNKEIFLLLAVGTGALLLTFLQTLVVRLFEGYHWRYLLITCAISAVIALGFAATAANIWATAGFTTTSIFLGVSGAYQGWSLTRRSSEQEAAYKNVSEARPAKGGWNRDSRTLQHEASRTFAHRPGDVLATRLGNIIRAFENHASAVYNIEPITTWPRLNGVIPREFRDKLADAEAATMAAVNSSAIAGLLSGELFAAALVFWWSRAPGAAVGILLTSATVALLVAWLMYSVACTEARENWGEHVRAAFDLYRLDVLRQIGVEMPASWIIPDERRIWRDVSVITFASYNPESVVRLNCASRQRSSQDSHTESDVEQLGVAAADEPNDEATPPTIQLIASRSGNSARQLYLLVGIGVAAAIAVLRRLNRASSNGRPPGTAQV